MKFNLKQRLLPPSSASFHYFEYSSSAKLDQIIESNSRLADELSRLNRQIDNIAGHSNRLELKVQILQQQLSYYSLALLNGGGMDVIQLFKSDASFFMICPRQLAKCVAASR